MGGLAVFIVLIAGIIGGHVLHQKNEIAEQNQSLKKEIRLLKKQPYLAKLDGIEVKNMESDNEKKG